jgi:hypothetical protein
VFDYEGLLKKRIEGIRAEGRYRQFANLERRTGVFRRAYHHLVKSDVTVWCSLQRIRSADQLSDGASRNRAASPYTKMVMATMAICILSFMVWLHHFFTMCAGADVNAAFGIATTIIAVPTGVKVFNWLFTMYGVRNVYSTPLLWSIGFMVTFVIGGMTGVLMAVPPTDRSWRT